MQMSGNQADIRSLRKDVSDLFAGFLVSFIQETGKGLLRVWRL